MKSTCSYVLFFFFLIVGVSKAHVALTFPPARQFPIDFLNTFWTKQPCGMPKGSVRTSLEAGKAFNATWHLGYAHQGGYRLELLDQNENKIMDLTPTSDMDFYQGQNTAQWHYINIPENATCQGCSIRLLRQVPEFSPNFQFISCADVDIVNRHNYVESCSGHGYVLSGGRCTCYAGYWGEQCQYQDECDTDINCNGVGRCIFLGGSALPRKQCFCPESHYGLRCNSRNPLNLPTKNNLNLKKHVRVKLDERFTMFFKILLGSSKSDDEIEFVLQINGTSYGGLGWRPAGLGPICKSWPFYQNAKYVQNSNNRISKRSPADTFTITKAIDHSDTYSPSSQQNNNYNNYNVLSTTSQQQTYQTIDNNRNNERSQQYNSNNNVQLIELVQPQRQQSPRVQSVKVTSTRFSSQVQQTTTSRPHPPQTPPPPPPPPQSQVSGSEWAAQDPFTPMDCSDIIVGTSRSSYHRVRDSYSRGRHTPLPDSIWGGRDDLIGASGWEQNGLTILVFRRRMDSSDGPDHSIRGDMQVIWARGQEPGEIVPMPQHQLVPGDPTVSHFYTRDELKYHGLGSQRGTLFIDFDSVRKEFVSGSYSQ